MDKSYDSKIDWLKEFESSFNADFGDALETLINEYERQRIQFENNQVRILHITVTLIHDSRVILTQYVINADYNGVTQSKLESYFRFPVHETIRHIV